MWISDFVASDPMATQAACTASPGSDTGPPTEARPERRRRTRMPARRLLLLTSVVSLLAACGGGGSGVDPSGAPEAAAGHYVVTLLASDQAGTANVNPGLSNPWDLVAGGGSMVWLTNNESNSSSLFNLGEPAAAALTIGAPPQDAASARPTGVAFNAGNNFEVNSAGRTGVARFIVASEGGTLAGWAPTLDIAHLVVAFDSSGTGALYTSLAMTPQGVDSVLLAVDFRNGAVETFTGDLIRHAGDGRFVDSTLPAGYSPFGIAVQGGLVYVTYAQRDSAGRGPRAGAGLGLVNAFSLTGQLVQRLVPAGSTLNAPWNVALAPATFGAFGGALLVANAGDGTIAAFEPVSGRSLGPLTQPDGKVVVVDGLHRIAFGNGALGQPTNSLFFTAGPQGGTHGRFGRIDPQ